MQGGALKTVVGAAMALGLGNRQKLEVYAVPVDQPLYVLGTVHQDHQGQLAVGKGDGAFLISTKSEEQLRRELGRRLIIYYVAAAVCLAAAIGLVIYALTAG